MKAIGRKIVGLFNQLNALFTVCLTFFTLFENKQKYGSFALCVFFVLQRHNLRVNKCMMQLIHRAGPCRLLESHVKCLMIN